MPKKHLTTCCTEIVTAVGAVEDDDQTPSSHDVGSASLSWPSPSWSDDDQTPSSHDVGRAYAALLSAQRDLVSAAERVRMAAAAEAGIRRAPVEIIAEVVARDASMTREELRSAKRTAGLALTRQVAMALCRELTGAAAADIGAEFDRDRSTVAWAVRQVRDRVSVEPALAEWVQRMRGACIRALAQQDERKIP